MRTLVLMAALALACDDGADSDTDAPLPAEEPRAVEMLQGALAISDHDTALEILTGMSDAQRQEPEVLGLRIQLAEATGKKELAQRLRDELENSR